MGLKIQKFDKWIRKHKYFAMALPVVILLSIFFIVTSLQSMELKNSEAVESGYNNSLPNQKNELQVKEPNTLYKQSLQDSLESLRHHDKIRNIVEAKKESDSLERIMKELENFSFSEDIEIPAQSAVVQTNATKDERSEFASKKLKVEEKLEYRKLLMEARDERLSRSQDYSAPYAESSSKNSPSSISLDAAIYRDQFILPGNRVTLILKEGTYYNGKRFPKNTFVYATANIQGSRILLEVTNIKNVKMSLTAIDQEDGMIGLHNERAGELMQEFVTDVQREGTDELSEAAGEITEMPLARNLVRSFGNFFTKKKYKQRDKILLVNGDRVFLTAKN